MSGIDRSRPDPHGQGQAAVREPAVPPRTRPAERYDVTQGGPGEDVWRLAWPILLSQLVSMAPGLYDAVWLGRLGSGA